MYIFNEQNRRYQTWQTLNVWVILDPDTFRQVDLSLYKQLSRLTKFYYLGISFKQLDD